MYLCNGPFHKRTTSQTGSVHFLKVVVRVAEVLADHYFPDVISKMERKGLIIVSHLVGFVIHCLIFRGGYYRNVKWPCFRDDLATYEMSSVEKFTMVEMKLSLMMTPRMVLQSVACSPSNKQMDSKASLTAGGGLPMERTSTRCCFLIDLTAVKGNNHLPISVPNLQYKFSLLSSTQFVYVGFENLVVHHFDFPWFKILFNAVISTLYRCWYLTLIYYVVDLTLKSVNKILMYNHPNERY